MWILRGGQEDPPYIYLRGTYRPRHLGRCLPTHTRDAPYPPAPLRKKSARIPLPRRVQRLSQTYLALGRGVSPSSWRRGSGQSRRGTFWRRGREKKRRFTAPGQPKPASAVALPISASGAETLTNGKASPGKIGPPTQLRARLVDRTTGLGFSCPAPIFTLARARNTRGEERTARAHGRARTGHGHCEA